jgi:hypothetical protein
MLRHQQNITGFSQTFKIKLVIMITKGEVKSIKKAVTFDYRRE